jgi:5-methylcytosine-specific restriction protein B
MSFTWIPFYEQLADKLTNWRERQSELIAFLRVLAEQGLPMVSLEDKSDGTTVPLAEIDPFTFFAAFNRNVRADNRQSILTAVREHFAVDAEVPSDFDGIPVADNMQSWFFPYKKDRDVDDVDTLWDLFAQAVHTGVGG